jgi:hypothetical protein
MAAMSKEAASFLARARPGARGKGPVRNSSPEESEKTSNVKIFLKNSWLSASYGQNLNMGA